MKLWVLVAGAVTLVGCARTSTIPLSQDTFQLTSRTAPICGSGGAEQVAFKQAAAEVIRRGHDKFIIVGGQQSAEVTGYTPVTANRFGNGVMVSGGDPMVAHGQGLVVKMFRDDDPAAANALSARQTLGPDWQQISQKTSLTCFD